jgi:hypothetical protein
LTEPYPNCTHSTKTHQLNQLGVLPSETPHTMPRRNIFLQDLDESLLITPRALINPEANIFDTSFSADIPIEEWQDWMKWDGDAIELDSTVLGQTCSLENTLSTTHSMYDAADNETALFSLFPTETEFPFKDALFEIEADESTDFSQFQTTSQMPMNLRKPCRGYSTLTAAEQQSLQDIAMPHQMLPQVKLLSEPSSPIATSSSQSRSPSPESECCTRKNKKRKSLVDDDGLTNESCQSRKTGHNAIEKRYRMNLNDKISCLGEGIPPLWRTSSTDSNSGDMVDESDHEIMDKKTGQQKHGKAAILARALEYIQYLENSTQGLLDEVAVFNTRVGAFERLAMSGSIVMSGAPAAAGLLTSKEEILQSIQAGTFFAGSISIYGSICGSNTNRFQANKA